MTVGGLAAKLLAICKPLSRLRRPASSIFRGHPSVPAVSTAAAYGPWASTTLQSYIET
ncbi:hypothetical protein Pan258_07740 [Symmachiella dynata]|nr:hypothetical protein Pan258_07740 [Symmachiella dynata]